MSHKFERNICPRYTGKESFEEWFAKFHLLLEIDGVIHPTGNDGRVVARNTQEYKKYEAKRAAMLKCMFRHQA